ncbi:Actophorin [Tritrichomonas foetus]|uniref:Actophorin n=1 Tax=Tritrichomonas foetus TaxID=1144522 RepID=A0A1J4K1M0_9EUKA|nr:Actophorin [Tritrichomonas foetus]|eukprot:OHT03373.1 Actophorin [Tritrichomonas foetus]
MSYIKVSDEAIRSLEETRTGKRFRYMIFGFSNDERFINLIKEEGPDANLNDFINDLPDNDVAYGYYSFNFKDNDGNDRSRMILFHWAPSSSPGKKKMMLSMSWQTIKNVLPGVVISYQCSSKDIITENLLQEKCLFQIH